MITGTGKLYGSFGQATYGLEHARLRVVDNSLDEFYARTQTQMFKNVLWIPRMSSQRSAIPCGSDPGS